MSALSQEVLKWLLSVLKPEYRHVQRTFDDAAETLSTFRTLRPKTDVYTSENGQVRLLLLLFGTIPINFRGSSYGIPVHIWVPQDFPQTPPLVFVVPSPGMGVRPNNYVDIDRRCYHPYLARWTTDVRQSRICQLVVNLQDVFSKEPPLYALPDGQSRETLHDRSGKFQKPPIPAKTIESQPTGREITPDRSANRVSSELNDYRTRPAPALPSNFIQPFKRAQPAQLSPQRTYTPSTASTRLSEIPPQSQVRSTDLFADDKMANTDSSPQISRDPSIDRARSHLLDLLKQKSVQEHKVFLDQVQELDNTHNTLQQVENELAAQLKDIALLDRASVHNGSILHDRIDQAKATIAQTETMDLPDIDQCLVAQNVVYNQLYDLVTTDQALEDTIYALGKALENERIELDLFLKSIKLLAREQFSQRALITKITEKLAI